MRTQRLSLDSIGTCACAVILVGIGLSLALALATDSAADDLHQQARIAASQAADHPRTAWGAWLSHALAPETPTSSAGMLERSNALSARADRIRELTAAGALAGLTLVLVTARPLVTSWG
jgi:hypothetical protein